LDAIFLAILFKSSVTVSVTLVNYDTSLYVSSNGSYGSIAVNIVLIADAVTDK
jgi:hypothetical protein